MTTLSAGSRLGSYTIGAPLGAGGMGEVYRARDTRLDRDVAIKILPPALAVGVLAGIVWAGWRATPPRPAGCASST